YGRLSAAMGKVERGEERAKMITIVIAVSFIYGLLHALGPGHRKTVLFSYFLANKVPLGRGIAAGVGMALLHGAAAAALIIPIYLLLRGSILVTFNTASRYIELGTFIFIALFGALMLTLSLIGIFRSKRAETTEGREKNTREADRISRGSMTALIVGSGLVPCPGAAMVLLFALSLQMVGVGIIAVAAMSLGMAATLAAVAFFTLGARSGLQRIGGPDTAVFKLVHHTLELGGYLIITIFGLVMTFGIL
ncbi:MAG: hypothetical protein R6V67_05210, partial [Spirochaetia bacterium]